MEAPEGALLEAPVKRGWEMEPGYASIKTLATYVKGRSEYGRVLLSPIVPFLAMNDGNYYAGHSSMALACSNSAHYPRVPTAYLPGSELDREENARLCSALEYQIL